MVLEGVSARISDFGSIRTDPEDYLERLVGFGLYTTDGCPAGELRPVPFEELAHIQSVARAAQTAHYRNIATMSRDEMIRCGASVYFTFLRPFADIAGVTDELDWEVPRDLPPPVYEVIVAVGETLGDAVAEDTDTPETYYLPLV